ncbi:MAG TPA: biotin--[acetyl-CoA-carboxylase] ligase [Phycisphaerae bacterium]|jgi:BirA family biotin operon repressor/biotin-[acetyl-CoA-carboxylase] ligase
MMMPIAQPPVSAVLMALWNASGGELPMQELVRESDLPLGQVQEALGVLAQRGAHIERTPTSLRLVQAGLKNWGDIMTAVARRNRWKVGRQVIVVEATSSTNDLAWQLAGADSADGTNDAGDGLVVLSDVQSAGRGRLGHSWHAKPGQSVLMSVMIRHVAAGSLDRLTLLAGLATAVALEEIAGGALARVEIKWPNDLLVSGRKMSGILIESSPQVHNAVVVGIGVNVAQAPHAGDYPADLAGRAISLFEEAGKIFDRLRVVLAILRQLDAHLLRGDSDWIGDWKSRCAMLGRTITLRAGTELISGQILDVEPLNGLVLRDERGHTRLFSAQTCSVADENIRKP